MNISESHRYLRDALTALYDQREAGNIADMVMEKISGLKRIDRVLNKGHELDPAQTQLLHRYADNLLQHQPVQYVLQEAWFYGMRLYVDERVLIPRPETEELAEWIIKEEIKKTTIIDIGTGSGCIAIALKKNVPAADIWAIDISEAALEVAQKNAGMQHTDITFLKADILQEAAQSSLPPFDIIVSNPPYIPASGEKEMSKNVTQYEPHNALFVPDNDPLMFYSAIAAFASGNLNANGHVYMEIHEAMGEAVKDIFEKHGLSDIIIRKDLQGKERMIRAGKR
ncbi:MAG: peptide chain release factor N(5)-glutamine methyltransferase [Sphingobacteriales bacterium]|nr:peptide chain release factor N(5)-glutamine methyltransferase [Sphingobacteriales bacterium]